MASDCACACHKSGYGGTLGPCWRCREKVHGLGCDNCGLPLAGHCRAHLIPCCPGKCDVLGNDGASDE